MGDIFISGEEKLLSGTLDMPTISRTRENLQGLIGDKYRLQEIFTDEGLPKSLQKRLRVLWNY